jgi:hypothetical protein
MPVLTSRPRALAAAALVGAALLTSPARAWWHGGFFIGVPPVVVAPVPGYPYYYPPAYYPPAYYPPAYYPQAYYPPAAYTPVPSQTRAQGSGTQGSDKVAYGAMCYAGVYHCAAPSQTPVGETCSCPGLGAPSYGSVQ